MSSPFLDLIAERVVVYDGAFGTYVQGLDLTADDFGGDDLEGCNEILAVTRPDVIAGLHEGYFAVGCDVTETATFGPFPTPPAEYRRAGRAHPPNVAAPPVAPAVPARLQTGTANGM